MDVEKVVRELKIKYPNRNIVINNPDDPTEIICEIEPASWNPDKSVAIAVIDSTVNHLHRRTKENYEVVRGILEINIAGQKHILSPGQSLDIMPLEKHTAKGNETWVKVTSTPAWDPKDHIIVKTD